MPTFGILEIITRLVSFTGEELPEKEKENNWYCRYCMKRESYIQ